MTSDGKMTTEECAEAWHQAKGAMPSSAGEYTEGLRATGDVLLTHLATLQRSADEGERTRELMALEYSLLCEYLGVVPDVAAAVISTLRSRERERQRSADEMRADKARLDWLEAQNVEVWTPLPPGAQKNFMAVAGGEQTLRSQVDKALLAKQNGE